MIGSGSHGEVRLCKMKSTGRIVVVKVPKVDMFSGSKNDAVVKLFEHEAAAQVPYPSTSYPVFITHRLVPFGCSRP